MLILTRIVILVLILILVGLMYRRVGGVLWAARETEVLAPIVKK